MDPCGHGPHATVRAPGAPPPTPRTDARTPTAGRRGCGPPGRRDRGPPRGSRTSPAGTGGEEAVEHGGEFGSGFSAGGRAVEHLLNDHAAGREEVGELAVPAPAAVRVLPGGLIGAHREDRAQECQPARPREVVHEGGRPGPQVLAEGPGVGDRGLFVELRDGGGDIEHEVVEGSPPPVERRFVHPCAFGHVAAGEAVPAVFGDQAADGLVHRPSGAGRAPAGPFAGAGF